MKDRERRAELAFRAAMHGDLFRAASDYLWRTDWTGREWERRIWDAFCEGATTTETGAAQGLHRDTVRDVIRWHRAAAGIPYQRSAKKMGSRTRRSSRGERRI